MDDQDGSSAANDGWRNALAAAHVLIEKSGLACYHGSHDYPFIARHKQSFDRHWPTFDPTFGRYMAWLWFEVGGENLAKAACVHAGYVTIEEQVTLGDYCSKYFRRFFLSDDDRAALRRGYKELKKRRNEDAHSYHVNVRDDYFPKVATHFVPAFNVLMKTFPEEYQIVDPPSSVLRV